MGAKQNYNREDYKPKVMPKHRQCAVCWGSSQGVGKATSTRKSITYYKCQNCGYTWSYKAKTPVEFHSIELEERERAG